MDWYLKTRAPLVLGHEPAGIVAEKGCKVRGFEEGDRVFVHHHVACLTCHYCLHGDYTVCEQFHNTNIKPGGFAQYFRVPAPNLQIDTLTIPETMSFEEATLIEPIGCCLRAINKSELRADDSVAIIGAGTTGIIHTMLSRLFGASHIIVSDLFDHRLDIARKLGADVIVNPQRESFDEVVRAETDGVGVDLAIVTAPSLNAYRAALGVCRKGGRLLVFAPTAPGQNLDMSPSELFFSEVRIIPSYSASHLETRQGLDLIRSERIRAKDLITHRYKLGQTADAFRTAMESNECLKVIVLNGD
jgi:L-iditol 2-dehydrogenase